MSRLSPVLIIALAVACAPTAQAQLIANGGFESPGFTPSPDYFRYLHSVYGTQNAISNWTFSDTTGPWEPSFWMKMGGGYDVYIGAGSYGVNLGNTGVMSTSFSVVSGQAYAVSFLARTIDPLTTNSLVVTAAGNAANFTPTASFATYSFEFTASSTGTAALSFALNSGNGAPQVANLDSVSVTAVPEPSSYAVLAGIIALALGIVRHRQRKFIPKK